MGIRSTFKSLFAGQPTAQVEDTPAPAPALTQVDATLAPGSRVHHEYFVADAPNSDGKWPWRARVYADNGAVNEEHDAADTPDLARNAALTWCARVKAQLGGE
jgi:hypothetical protein